MFLLDTNVLSEVRKRRRSDPNVVAWFESVDDDDLYISVVILGEIRRGIERLRRHDVVQAAALEDWLNRLSAEFADRVLPIDHAVADEWGRLAAIRTVPVIDGLIAATARVHGMAIATRNEGDFTGLGAQIVNPFRAREYR